MVTVLDRPRQASVAEIAREYRVHPNTVYKYAKEPGFPAVRFGGQIRIDRDRLPAWLEERSA